MKRPKAPAAIATSARGPTGPSKTLEQLWRATGQAPARTPRTQFGDARISACRPSQALPDRRRRLPDRAHGRTRRSSTAPPIEPAAYVRNVSGSSHSNDQMTSNRASRRAGTGGSRLACVNGACIFFRSLLRCDAQGRCDSQQTMKFRRIQASRLYDGWAAHAADQVLQSLSRPCSTPCSMRWAHRPPRPFVPEELIVPSTAIRRRIELAAAGPFGNLLQRAVLLPGPMVYGARSATSSTYRRLRPSPRRLLTWRVLGDLQTSQRSSPGMRA